MGEASVDLVIWFQENLPWLVPIAHVFTVLGDEDFYVIAFPFLYWSLSPRIGVRMGAMLLVSAGLNGALKLAFATPRPFWVSGDVEAYVLETSFGVPSGHAQNAVAVWGTLAHALTRSWAWVVAVVLIVAIGTSRWVVGVHAVEDTLSGWAVGGLLLVGYVWAEPRVRGWLARGTFGLWIAVSFVAPLVIIAVAVVARVARAAWELPEAWAANFAAAFPGEPALDPLTIEGVFTPAGALCGVGIGLAILVRTAGGFVPSPAVWRRLVCYPLGLVGVVALWMGLGTVFPSGEEPLALALRFVRFALVTVWMVGIAPLLFLRVGLASPVRRDSVSA